MSEQNVEEGWLVEMSFHSLQTTTNKTLIQELCVAQYQVRDILQKLRERPCDDGIWIFSPMLLSKKDVESGTVIEWSGEDIEETGRAVVYGYGDGEISFRIKYGEYKKRIVWEALS